MTNTRVNVGRMTLVLLVTLIMPLIIGVCLDLLIDTSPWITVCMGIISLPFSAFFVVRQGKYEMERVIEAVAPEQSPTALSSDSINSQQG
jgi:F0F1-type ATP synthase assembly protein I